MAAEDVIIRIDGDASGAVAASAAASRAYHDMAARIQTDTEAMRTSAHRYAVDAERAQQRVSAAQKKAASDAHEAAANNLNAWKRADVAGVFRGWIDAAEEWHEGAAKVGASAMRTRAAMLALGAGITATAAAATAAGVAVVGSSVQIVAGLDDATLAISRHKGQLVDAHGAYVGLTEQVTALRVEIAGQMAPALGYMFDVMGGGIATTNDLVAGMYDLADGVGLNIGQLARYTPVLLDILRVTDMVAERGRQARQDAAAAAAGAAAGAALGSALGSKLGGPKFNMEADVRAEAEAQAAADAMMLVGQAAANAAASVKAAGAGVAQVAMDAKRAAEEQLALEKEAAMVRAQRIRESIPLLQQELDLNRSLRDVINEQTEALRQKADAMPDASTTVSYGGIGSDVADTAEASAARSEKAWVGTFTNIVGAAGNAANAIIGAWSASKDAQVRISKELSAHERQMMREQFRRQKAAAIAQALINGAVAFTSALSTQPIYVGIALAALTAVLTGVQVAAIARQQPSTAHRGRSLAPDEVAATTVLRTERVEVVPRRGQDTSADVARMASGERRAPSPSGSEAAVYVTVVSEGRPAPTRAFAGMSARLGRMVRG